MIRIVGEQENYLVVTNGTHCTVVERRAGRYYPLGKCSVPSVELDEQGFAQLVQMGGAYSEGTAMRRMSEVASQWRDLFELLR
jgi:hypothetical protein